MEELFNQYGPQTLILIAVASIGYFIFIWRPQHRQMKIVSLQNKVVTLWRGGVSAEDPQVQSILDALNKLGIKPVVTFPTSIENDEDQNG